MTSQSQRIDLSMLATEQRNPASARIDLLDTEGIVRVMNDQDHLVAEAVARVVPSIVRAVDIIAAALDSGGRLIYIGAGTSGRLGVLDASECPPTFNTDPNLVIGLIAGGDHALRHSIEHVEDSPEEGASALRAVDLNRKDVIVGIAASGRTPFVLGAIDFANSIGAQTIAVCNSPASPLADQATIAIEPVVGPEVVTGSTRMKAGAAQKMVLNMLSTAAMIKLGKTYGNLMVDVQPTNAKLRERAVGIVRDGAEVTDEQARKSLDAAGGEVNTAIVASKLRISAGEARARLESSRGVIRVALGESHR